VKRVLEKAKKLLSAGKRFEELPSVQIVLFVALGFVATVLLEDLLHSVVPLLIVALVKTSNVSVEAVAAVAIVSVFVAGWLYTKYLFETCLDIWRKRWLH